MKTRFLFLVTAATAALACAIPAGAASITTYGLTQPGPDSLAFVVDSIAASSITGPFSRYRLDNSGLSSMASTAPPNSNLVTIGNLMWFTRRVSPYRVGRADLSIVTGNIDNFTPPGIVAPFDDMVLGPDSALWATNAGSNLVARVPVSGSGITSYSTGALIYPLGITRGSDGNIWFADGVNRRITRINPTTLVFTNFAVPQLSAKTIPERITGVGTTDGILWFATQDGFGSLNPLNGAIKVVATEAQTPRRIAAASDGTIWLTDGTPFVTQFTPPANYAKLRVFSNVTAKSAGLYIHADGTVYVGDNDSSKLARIGIAQVTPADTTVTEFFNSTLNHYFITANPAEANAIDGGSAGPGWTRTNQQWKAWVNGPIPLAAEVCRFYGSTDINPATGQRRGPNSHFYTVEPGECAAVKTDAGWTYEFAGKFWMVKPVNQGCPTWTQPVYRVYNNRFAQNDSNHRYMTSQTIYNQMLAQNWSGEGVVMCAPL